MKFAYLIMYTATIASSLANTTPAKAENMLGQIIMGGWNFCPKGTLPADGRVLPIAPNSALFSLLGTQYGGNGRTTFRLPDLRGASPVGDGTAIGLTSRRIGSKETIHSAQKSTRPNARLRTVAIKYCIVEKGRFPARNLR